MSLDIASAYWKWLPRRCFSSELRGKNLTCSFFCRNFPRLLRGALLQVRVPWQSNNIPEQVLEHRIVRVTAVWPRITHLEGEAQELFFCMGRRMGENQETKLEMKDHLSFAILGTRVGVSVALELDASLAKCAGRQNDPTGSPAHPWRRCVTVTRSSAGCLYSIQPGETRCLWASVMEKKRVFLCPSQHCSSCGGNPSFYFDPMLSCLEGVPVCWLLPCCVWPWRWYFMGSMAYSIKQVLHLARLPATT